MTTPVKGDTITSSFARTCTTEGPEMGFDVYKVRRSVPRLTRSSPMMWLQLNAIWTSRDTVVHRTTPIGRLSQRSVVFLAVGGVIEKHRLERIGSRLSGLVEIPRPIGAGHRIERGINVIHDHGHVETDSEFAGF